MTLASLDSAYEDLINKNLEGLNGNTFSEAICNNYEKVTFCQKETKDNKDQYIYYGRFS
jgi:hypothetical protein